MTAIANCFDNSRSKILIVDEADVDVTQCFVMSRALLCRDSVLAIQVIFHMPELPPYFFQLASRQGCYYVRANELKRYAIDESVRHAHQDVYFIVAYGSAQKIRQGALSSSGFMPLTAKIGYAINSGLNRDAS